LSRVAGHFGRWLLGLADPETQTSPAERAALARHAAGRRRLAEIGVWHGVTTRQLRAVMAADGVYFAIDPYPPGRFGFSTQRVIAHTGVGRVRNGAVVWLRTIGAAAAADPRVTAGGVDFLFIDGDHSYDGLKADWDGWSGHVRPAGIVALHDSFPAPGKGIEAAGSVRFTREVVAHDRRFEPVEVVETLTVLRRAA
jgi:predicted O-methyltransferase YrrM